MCLFVMTAAPPTPPRVFAPLRPATEEATSADAGSPTGVVSGSSTEIPPGFGSGAQVTAVVPGAGTPAPATPAAPGPAASVPVVKSGPAPGTSATPPRLSAGSPLARTGADLSVVLALALLLVLVGLHLSRLTRRRVTA